ncbi:Uncharacterised protein, partial [Mycoplasma putrefaciens]
MLVDKLIPLASISVKFSVEVNPILSLKISSNSSEEKTLFCKSIIIELTIFW